MVEFLEYWSPSTGRPYPADSLSNDLWHWDITMVVADATAREMGFDPDEV